MRRRKLQDEGVVQKVETALRIKKVVDQMPGGFFTYYAGGNEEIIYANEAMCQLFGCETLEEFREWTGNSFRGVVHPDDLEEVEESIVRQIAESQYDLDYVEYRIIRKDGSIRWVEDYGHFVHDDDMGDIFYVFVGDATEKRKLMSFMNQEHLRRLETIEGLSIDYESIFYVDLDNDRMKPYRMSHRVADIFGLDDQEGSFSEIHEAFIKKWIHEDDRKVFSEAIQGDYIRKRLEKNKSFHINYRIVENGESSFQQLRVVNVGSSEKISQVVLGYRSMDREIIHEMEQKKILEDALQQANAAIIAKDTFLTNMSHDIITPMNAIVGFTMLAKKYADDKGKIEEYLDKIEESNNQLLQLLTDILKITKIEAGKTHISEDRCSLTFIVRAVYNSMAVEASKKGIDLTMDLSRLKHDEVYADRQKLCEMLIRLLDNAVKYTRQGGWVRISLTELEKSQGDYAGFCFSIEDNGIGISENFMSRLFDPFERQRNSTLSGVSGTGLGLTITKNIVEMMGGTIDVESKPGKGSCFTITLSLKLMDAVKEETEKKAPESKKQMPDSRRILLVEDNEINLEIETELLEGAGFIVDTAMNGMAAVERMQEVEEGYYSLILMDIQMPIMDGYQAASMIRGLEREGHAQVPIIALSANALEADRRKAMESGMDTHMAKPLDVSRLLDIIKDMGIEL